MIVQYTLDKRLHPWCLACIDCRYGFFVHVGDEGAAETYGRLHADVAHHTGNYSILHESDSVRGAL